MGKTPRYKYVRLCMILARFWNLEFRISPYRNFIETGMWNAEFGQIGIPRIELPGTGACGGKTVEGAAKGLLRCYLSRYGDKVSPKIASVTELIARYEFLGGFQ